MASAAFASLIIGSMANCLIVLEIWNNKNQKKYEII